MQQTVLDTALLSKGGARLTTAGGGYRNYCVRPAGDVPNVEPPTIARLYNNPIKDGNRIIQVTPELIEARLEADPTSVLLGFLDGDFSNPVTMINIVKLMLDSLVNFPETHAKLTTNDTYSETMVDGANVWSCPWVVVSDCLKEPESKSRVMVDGQLRSLGQAIVRAVGIMAKDQDVPLVVAFTRPYDIKAFMEQNYCSGHEVVYEPKLETCHAVIKNPQSGLQFYFDRHGVGLEMYPGYLFSWADYVNMPHPACPERFPEVRRDSVLGFHINNGAIWVSDLVRPHAQVDKFSLGMRMGVIYVLDPDSPLL